MALDLGGGRSSPFIHRADMPIALGCLEPAPVDLAVDGVDKIFAIMLTGDWSDALGDGCPGQPVGVSTAGRDWLITLANDGATVSEAQGAADAVLDGDPSDMVPWLWGRRGDEGRVPPASREVVGPLRGRLKLATQ